MDAILNGLRGKESLPTIFLIPPFIILMASVITNMVRKTLFPGDLTNLNLAVLTIAFCVPWIWYLTALWQCAFNCKWRGWGYITRTAVGLVATSVVLYVALFTYLEFAAATA